MSSVSHVCTFCQLGKSHKLPFKNSETVYKKPLEMIVFDLWGPTPIDTDYGFNYYMSFVDAHSRYLWIYILRNKTKTLSIVLQFIKYVENQTGHKLKTIQTDGGSKFKPLKSYFHDKGIDHKVICPHTSDQNGLIERRHRHIVETGLTLLAQASMPLIF